MTSSSEDSSAPLDFQVSSSIEESCKINNCPTEDCPLCCRPRRNFYCNICVKNGDFVHSASRYNERFAEKQLRLLRLQKERSEKVQSCEAKLTTHINNAILINDINMSLERIRCLKQLIENKKKTITERKVRAAKLKDNNKDKADRLPKYEERVGKLAAYVKNKSLELKEQEKTLRAAQHNYKKVVRSSIKHLVTYIFPIYTVKPTQSVEECEAVRALADASRTNFIRGKWVFSEKSTDVQHCIVVPTLPSSGDYSSYCDWVAANKDAVPGGVNETVDRNPAYTISAALTYTTQLVNLLAYYLDVRLPTKLNYSEFCGNELGEDKFARRVARLNWNVIFLCLTQNVDPQLLNSQSTLQNIMHLLDTSVSDLGRMGPCEVDPEASKNLEDALKPYLESASDSEDSEEESDHFPCEWEAVANVGLPEVSAGPVTHTLSHQISSSSVAGGLVTSAAASLASFWRGWTAPRDKMARCAVEMSEKLLDK